MRSQFPLEEAMATCKTPFYVFDEDVLSQRIAAIRSMLPPDTRIAYAMKANTFVMDAASRAADLIEVCSPGELEVCRALGVPDEMLVISGVYKEAALMRRLISSGVRVHRYTAESPAQFALLEAAAREAGVQVPVLLRLTSGNQFGMDVEDLRRLVREGVESDSVLLCGIQYFSGTQKRSAGKLRREIAMLDKLISQLQEDCGVSISELEYGPGTPIDYCEEDDAVLEATDTELFAALSEALSSMKFEGTRILEIGRGIAAYCGTYVTRVVDTKCNKGHSYAIVDGGKHQLVFYGQTLALRPPVARFVPERTEGSASTWTICGALCTSGDTLVAQTELADLRVGDLVVFPHAGAYSMTEGMSLFLSRDLPRVYLYNAENGPRLVRDRFETSVLNTPRNKQDERQG